MGGGRECDRSIRRHPDQQTPTSPPDVRPSSERPQRIRRQFLMGVLPLAVATLIRPLREDLSTWFVPATLVIFPRSRRSRRRPRVWRAAKMLRTFQLPADDRGRSSIGQSPPSERCRDGATRASRPTGRSNMTLELEWPLVYDSLMSDDQPSGTATLRYRSLIEPAQTSARPVRFKASHRHLEPYSNATARGNPHQRCGMTPRHDTSVNGHTIPSIAASP